MQQRVCRLITIQRGIVRIARRLDEALGNGDQHENQFSSSEFLDQLHSAIISDESGSERRFTNAEAYVQLSFRRTLELGDEIYDFITHVLTPRLEELRNLIRPLHSLPTQDDGQDIAERAKTSAHLIEALGLSLHAASDDRFIDQVESGVVALSGLLECSKSMSYQISLYEDRHRSFSNDQRTRRQNSKMIFWAAIGALGALFALIVALVTMDIEKIRAIWQLIHH